MANSLLVDGIIKMPPMQLGVCLESCRHMFFGFFRWDYAIIIADKSCLLPWQKIPARSHSGNWHTVNGKVHLMPDATIQGFCFMLRLLAASRTSLLLYNFFFLYLAIFRYFLVFFLIGNNIHFCPVKNFWLSSIVLHQYN